MNRVTWLLLLGTSMVVPRAARAHCDTMDGPVVGAAREALATDRVELVLPWVPAADEEAVRAAFARAAAVRGLGPEALELADHWFFETVVRIHRAGEGEPFEGLLPAGTDAGPVVAAADRAIEGGSSDALVDLVTGAARDGLRARFRDAIKTAHFEPTDVAAGREHVHAYVTFLHYAESVYDTAIAAPSEEHARSAEVAPAPPEVRNGADAATLHRQPRLSSPGVLLPWALVGILALILALAAGRQWERSRRVT
jgi:hypothetical protein